MLRSRFLFLLGVVFAFFGSGAVGQTPKTEPSGNPLVTALWFSHRYAKSEVLTSIKDRQLKTTLIKAIRGKSPGLSWDEVSDLFEKGAFQKIAGDGDKVSLEVMERMLKDKTPLSRDGLFPKVRLHADLLTTQFDLIEEKHRAGAEELLTWIGKNYDSKLPMSIIVICTGNSRRSILGSTMGNIAAAYYGLPNIRFFSGGTTPSSFNNRAIATLKEIGVEIELSGKEAPRGLSGEVNPIYHVRWGKGMENLEFSKRYSDAQNPQKDFAAILVCSEADTSCPTVKGASARIAVPYVDPKVYDGAAFEAAKYAERRDDIERFMLNVLMQARRRVVLEDK